MAYTELLQLLPLLTGGNSQQGGTGGFMPQQAGTMALGAVQTAYSLIKLRELSKQERPNYTISPEQQKAYDLSAQRSRFGFTPQQIGAFNQGMAQGLNTDFYNTKNMAGGNLATAIAGALSSRRMNMLNQFAAQDASQQERNIGQFYGQAGAMQRQRNIKTQQDIAIRMAKEQALGGALKAGTTNMASAINANQALGSWNTSKTSPSESDSGVSQPNYAGVPSVNQPPYNPYGGQIFAPQNFPNTQYGEYEPPANPWGGNLWNPYNQAGMPFLNPPMMSVENQ